METIFFIAGTLLGSLISHIAFKYGSSNTHQAYEVVYTPVPEPTESDEEGTKSTQLDTQIYDWDQYSSEYKWQKFEKDDSNPDEKPN